MQRLWELRCIRVTNHPKWAASRLGTPSIAMCAISPAFLQRMGGNIREPHPITEPARGAYPPVFAGIVFELVYFNVAVRKANAIAEPMSAGRQIYESIRSPYIHEKHTIINAVLVFID